MTDQADYRYVLMESIAGLMEKARKMAPSTPYEQGRSMAYFEILSALSLLPSLRHDTSSAPRMLTPSEIDWLRRNKKATLERLIALANERPLANRRKAA